MKAGSNGKPHAAPIEYTECDWGDLIKGTKEQLQDLGIGIGRAFPGEPDGPRRQLNTHDQRGYPAQIEVDRFSNGAFTCSLKFPHWPKRPDLGALWPHAAPGVGMRHCTWFDEYIGSADDLAAAGLVRLDQLPGQPGTRKVRVTIFPDGSVPTGARTATYSQARMPGAKTIERASASSFRVRINVVKDEGERRLSAGRAAESVWLQQVRALPRPARLLPTPPQFVHRLRNSTMQAKAQPASPLFGDAPTAPRESQAYQKHVFDSLRDLVDFTQTSAY